MGQVNYEVLQEFNTLTSDSKRKITQELLSYLKRHERYALETELYKLFRIPPFIITKDKEVLFTDNVE